MTRPRFEVHACGDDALTIQCGEGPVRHLLAHQLSAGNAWVDIVPGKRDVTVSFDPQAERMHEAIERLEAILGEAAEWSPPETQTHGLAAEFGGEAGPDLTILAKSLDIAPSELVARVAQSPLSVDMLGFTPGFAYLSGLNPSLVAERLATPRTRVGAGSIGLITGQIGLYALDGPGGWPIIGRILTPLFDKALPQPFLLAPGDRVIIRPVAP